MQITLNQNEIEAGIKMYIESRGISLTDRDILMDFTAARKGNAGINVDVDLGEDSFFRPSNIETKPTPLHNNTVVTLTSSGGVSAKRTAAPVVEKQVEPNEPVPAEEPAEPVKRTRKAKVEAAEPEAPAEPEVKEEKEEAPAEEPVSELTQPQPETAQFVANPNSLFGGASVAPSPTANEPAAASVEPAMSKSLFG